MRRWIIMVLVFVASGAGAQTKLKIGNPPTDPPNKSYVQEQIVRKLNLYEFCTAPCGGSADTPTPAPTATPVVFLSSDVSTATCVDSGDASRGALTLTPDAGIILLTVNDADGCDVMLDETGAAEGRNVVVRNVSANFARFANQSGVLSLPHEVYFLLTNDVIVLDYSDGQWNKHGGNDPTTVALTLKNLTDFADVPSFVFSANPEQVAIVCTDTLSSANSCLVAFPSGAPEEVQFKTGKCTCMSPGVTIGSSATSTAHSGSVAIGEDVVVADVNGIAIGTKAATEGSGGAISIGENNTTSDQMHVTGSESIAIGRKDDIAKDLTGLRFVQIGSSPQSQDGDSSVCLGEETTCDADNGVAIGHDAVNSELDFTFGSTTFALHPFWPGATPGVSSCGTDPAITGTDVAGEIVVGSGTVTSCTVTFEREWAQIPSCFVNNETTIQLLRAVTTTTTLVIDASATFDGDTIRYGCPVS